MRRASPSRGYLSRIAEPMRPNEPALKSLHNFRSPAPEQVEIPVVEDHIVTPETPLPGSHARPSTASQLGEPAGSAPASPRLDRPFASTESAASALPARTSARSAATAIPESQSESPSRAAVSGSVVSSRHGRGSSSPEPNRALPVRADSSRTRDTKRGHEHSVVAYSFSADEPELVMKPPAMIAERPVVAKNEASLSAAEPEKAEPHFSKPGTPAPSHQSRAKDPGDKSAVPNDPAVASPKNADRSARPEAEDTPRSGVRVHIGTVEIRAVLPQPVVQPAAPQRREPQPDRTVQARVPAGAEPQLARGLAWSFGLVQG